MRGDKQQMNGMLLIKFQVFWQWQWEMHYKAKKFLSLLFHKKNEKHDANRTGEGKITDVRGNGAAESGAVAPPPDNGKNEDALPSEYSLRNKIGLVLGPLSLLIILFLSPSMGMFETTAKIVITQEKHGVLQAGNAAGMLILDDGSRIRSIPDTKKFLQWLEQKYPQAHEDVVKKTKAMKNCLAVLILMVIWWICESIPWGVTGLIPAALFPLLGVSRAAEACAPYANKVVILFIGAFFIAQAILKWKLHRRIALFIVDKIGSSPKRIVLGFMVASAFLSMWISNTATALMMMPMGMAIIMHTAEVGKLLQAEGKLAGVDFTPGLYVFGSCLMLGIGYASNAGGMGTLIGTPPNIIYAGQLAFLFPGSPPVDFSSWLMFGFPMALITTLSLWALLVFVMRRPEITEIPGGTAIISEERRKLGSWSRGEKIVGIIFLVTALCWIFQSEKNIGGITIYGLQTFLPWIDDSTIAVFMAIALFMIPVSIKKSEFVLSWDWAVKIPWGLILLFGGGFSLANGISSTGAATWVGNHLALFAHLPMAGLMFGVGGVIALVSTVCTNTATATIFMPILGTMAQASNFDPRFLMILGCLASQSAYVLPVAAAPLAICFGSGYVRMQDFVKVGIVATIIAIIISVLGIMVLLGPTFGISAQVMPPWAQ